MDVRAYAARSAQHRPQPWPRGSHAGLDGHDQARGKTANAGPAASRRFFKSEGYFSRQIRVAHAGAKPTPFGARNVEFIEERGPSYLVEGMVLVPADLSDHGFREGISIHYSEINGTWQSDPLIHDDQALVVNVRDKGLVVLTGWVTPARSTPFDTLRSSAGPTRSTRCWAGCTSPASSLSRFFHRPQELEAIGPRLIMPGHCTGWKATHEFAREFPDEFIQPSVGTRLVIESGSVT